MTEEKKHGGRRPHAGRPRVYSERATRTTVYLEPEEAQRLREIGGTVTGGIRVLLAWEDSCEMAERIAPWTRCE